MNEAIDGGNAEGSSRVIMQLAKSLLDPHATAHPERENYRLWQVNDVSTWLFCRQPLFGLTGRTSPKWQRFSRKHRTRKKDYKEELPRLIARTARAKARQKLANLLLKLSQKAAKPPLSGMTLSAHLVAKFLIHAIVRRAVSPITP